MVRLPESKDPFHGRDGFNNVKFNEMPDVGRVQRENAVEAIKRIVRENPGRWSVAWNSWVYLQSGPSGC